MSDQWGNAPQGPQEPAEAPTQPAFPQYAQQYPETPGAGAGYGSPDPGYGYGYPGGFVPPRNSKLAVASFVLGIVSFPLIVIAVLGPLVALVGLVLGLVGISGAARRNLKRGLGVAGIVLSVLGLVGGSLVTTVELHAANACRQYRAHTSAYSDCIKKNSKF